MALPNKTKIPVGYVLSGKYRITREIGRGGMAAVYEAENVDIGKRVAIKVLAQELTSSAVVVERFLREARAAAAIRSPHICDVYDSGRLEDGRPFLVLELLEGESLYEQMTRVRHMDVPTTLNIIAQSCRGLTKAHASSIVHRDLKPENIFITKDEEGRLLAKILDFGLAKFYAPMEGTGHEKQARLTREGAVFGTPAYMSPEQVRGQGAVDHRADLWALGCIVYECLTGKTVWATEQGVAMTFAQIANAPLPRPSKYRPDLAASFTDWFDRALDRDIEKRFQSAKEFAEELAAALEHTAPSFSHLEVLPTLGAGDLREVADSAVTTKKPRPAEVDAATRKHSKTVDTEPPPSTSKGTEDVPIFMSDLPPPPSEDGGKVEVAPAPRVPDIAADGRATPAPVTPPSPPPSPRLSSRSSSSRSVVVFGGLALAVVAAFAMYKQFSTPTPTGLTVSSATSATSTPPVAPTGLTTAASVNAAAPPWKPLVGEAQQMVADGNLKGAIKALSDAFDKGGHGVPKTMREQVSVALAAGSAPCKLTGLARPRTYDFATPAPKPAGSGRPSIAVGSRGPVIVWTDSHEGSEHAYAVALDPAMRNAAEPLDVTPEGATIGRPEVMAVGERFVMTYWDSRGPEAGVHVRWLDGDAHIAGPSVAVVPVKPGNYWPTLTRLPDGTFFAAWSAEGDADSEDLFLRQLSPNLEPMGEVARATDLLPAGSKPRARLPWIAVHGDALHVAYRLERDPVRLINNQRIPIADAVKGLGPGKLGPKGDRFLGEVTLVNTDKAKSDAPALACGGGNCFLVWHGESNGGVSAAYIDPQKSTPLWRKKFSKTGGHPVVAVSPSGQAQIAWFDRGGVMVASVGRDGVGPPTKIARVLGDQPMPSIAPGSKAGEWYVAWLDYEIGHLEPYAARVICP